MPYDSHKIGLLRYSPDSNNLLIASPDNLHLFNPAINKSSSKSTGLCHSQTTEAARGDVATQRQVSAERSRGDEIRRRRDVPIA